MEANFLCFIVLLNATERRVALPEMLLLWLIWALWLLWKIYQIFLGQIIRNYFPAELRKFSTVQGGKGLAQINTFLVYSISLDDRVLYGLISSLRNIREQQKYFYLKYERLPAWYGSAVELSLDFPGIMSRDWRLVLKQWTRVYLDRCTTYLPDERGQSLALLPPSAVHDDAVTRGEAANLR